MAVWLQLIFIRSFLITTCKFTGLRNNHTLQSDNMIASDAPTASTSHVPDTSSKGAVTYRPFGIKINRLSCSTRNALGTPPGSPENKEPGIPLASRLIHEYQLRDAGIYLVRGTKGEKCQYIDSDKFFEFDIDTPTPPLEGIPRWIFKQEMQISQESLASLNIRHAYLQATAFEADRYGYIHTTLAGLVPSIMSQVFLGGDNLFTPTHLACDYEGHFGLLMPMIEGETGDEMLVRTGLIRQEAAENNLLAAIEPLIEQKHRYFDENYFKTANSAFDTIFKYHNDYMRIKFIDWLCLQLDRSKLTNIIIKKEDAELPERKLVAIDPDYAFPNFVKRPYNPLTDLLEDPTVQYPTRLQLTQPCCKIWVKRLLSCITPFLTPAKIEQLRTSLSTAFPYLQEACNTIGETTATSSSGSGHVTPDTKQHLAIGVAPTSKSVQPRGIRSPMDPSAGWDTSSSNDEEEDSTPFF
ncbi:hypothetical protein [Kistimonas asteriae]|uniref:hypothetical protein n=1 Tax=Kistimonas asteriae TaxID=517724 RepID=UPI001BAC218B|nr:hypothetical protein [Kistimonas asteriae]